jgi:hypothetical protein
VLCSNTYSTKFQRGSALYLSRSIICKFKVILYKICFLSYFIWRARMFFLQRITPPWSSFLCPSSIFCRVPWLCPGLAVMNLTSPPLYSYPSSVPRLSGLPILSLVYLLVSPLLIFQFMISLLVCCGSLLCMWRNHRSLCVFTNPTISVL